MQLQRRFFLLAGFGGVRALVQKSAICLLPLRTAAAVCLLAAALARPRTDPATAFAPLSHMLIKGFFFVHGFFMMSLGACARGEKGRERQAYRCSDEQPGRRHFNTSDDARRMPAPSRRDTKIRRQT